MRAHARHERNQRDTRRKQQRRFDERGAGRLVQIPPVKDLLQDLGVDLHARDALAQGRSLKVEQAEPGHAHEDQLAAQRRRARLAAQHVLGRDEPRRIMRPEVGPERAIGLHRDHHVAEARARRARRRGL